MWIGNANTKFGEPGKEYTWTDKSIDKSGWHEYEVIAYSENGNEPGRVARMRVFVGADVAKTPVVNLTDAVNDIKASWNKVSNVGANNGYVIRIMSPSPSTRFSRLPMAQSSATA